MTDKEKYTRLMQRYWEAETTPEEERDLARYAAGMDDSTFDEIRGVLGYISVGRATRARKGRRGVRLYPFAAAAAGVAAVIAVSLTLLFAPAKPMDNLCVRYAYGVKTDDGDAIMASVEASLADFFAGETPAEVQLFEMFQR